MRRSAGTLVRRDSSPVVTAKIKLPVLERTATTDDSGHFQLNNVPAGTHQVTVWAPGAAPVSLEVVLLAGETYNMRIVLADDVQQLQGDHGLGAQVDHGRDRAAAGRASSSAGAGATGCSSPRRTSSGAIRGCCPTRWWRSTESS